MLYGLLGVLTKIQTKSIPYTFNRDGYYYFSCRMYLRLPSHKQYLVAEVLESNDPQNIREEPDTTRDEIIDKTLGEYTAAMATLKL